MKVTEALILTGVLLFFGPLMAQSDLPVYKSQTVASSQLSSPHSPHSVSVSPASCAPLADSDLSTFCLMEASEGPASFSLNFNLLDQETSAQAVNAIWIRNGVADNFGQFARVKSLRLLINGKAHGTIQLQDISQLQKVETEELLLVARQNNEFTFEILETYPGLEPGTAITEIYLDSGGS